MLRHEGTILECESSETEKGFKEGKIKPDRDDSPILDFTRCPHNFEEGDKVTFEIIAVRSGEEVKGIAEKVEPVRS